MKRPAVVTIGAIERLQQSLAGLFPVVAPPTPSNQPSITHRLNVRAVNLMGFRNCTSGDNVFQTLVRVPNLPHRAIEVLTCGALTTVPAPLQTPPQDIVSDTWWVMAVVHKGLVPLTDVSISHWPIQLNRCWSQHVRWSRRNV